MLEAVRSAKKYKNNIINISIPISISIYKGAFIYLSPNLRISLHPCANQKMRYALNHNLPHKQYIQAPKDHMNNVYKQYNTFLQMILAAPVLIIFEPPLRRLHYEKKFLLIYSSFALIIAAPTKPIAAPTIKQIRHLIIM